MSDEAHDWTDERIAEMQAKFREAFARAANEMQDDLEAGLKTFAEQNLAWQERVEKGTTTESNYKEWLEQQAIDAEWRSDMVEKLALDALRADELAMEAINDELPEVYAENANYMAYKVDTLLGRDTKFTLYDTETVRNLLLNDPSLYPTAKLDVVKDLAWNRRKMAGEVTQGVLRGESVPKIAKRLENVLGMDERSATRAARTATTAAENLGRTRSLKRAKDMGLGIEQLWIATLDLRTRETHRDLDMQHVPVGKRFKTFTGVELACPGDPDCKDPSEVYNCRCTLGAWMKEMDIEGMERWKRLPDDMTYEEWKGERRENGGEPVVNGKNILGTWSRRPDEFKFEIEDVLNAQGFDGLPRVVDAVEFDRLAKESNFIAVRGYRAPDAEVLAEYQRQLYGGKWYVDCSTGGAYHGQGMYTFSADAAKPTEAMLQGVKSFSGDGAGFGRVETMTVDASFRAVAEDDIVTEFSKAALEGIGQKYGEDMQKVVSWSTGNATPDETYGEVSQRVYSSQSMELGEAMNDYIQASNLYGMDKGVAAATIGYDGIHVRVDDSTRYTVILNRTKVIIRGEE